MIATIRRAGVVLAAAAALTVTAAPAFADQPTQAGGACSATSFWKLRIIPGNGFLRVTYTIDSTASGQPWQFSVNSGHGALIAGGRLPTDAGGSFSVNLIAPDLSGPDTVTGAARNTVTGETCKGGTIQP